MAASGDEVSTLHGMECRERIRAAVMCRCGPPKTAYGGRTTRAGSSFCWPASAHHSRSDALLVLHAMKSRHLVSRGCHTASLAIFGKSKTSRALLLASYGPASFAFTQFHDRKGHSNTLHVSCVHCFVLQRHILHSSSVCENVPSVSGLRTS